MTSYRDEGRNLLDPNDKQATRNQLSKAEEQHKNTLRKELILQQVFAIIAAGVSTVVGAALVGVVAGGGAINSVFTPIPEVLSTLLLVSSVALIISLGVAAVFLVRRRQIARRRGLEMRIEIYDSKLLDEIAQHIARLLPRTEQ